MTVSDLRRGGLMSSTALDAVMVSSSLMATMNMFRRWGSGIDSKAGESRIVLEMYWDIELGVILDFKSCMCGMVRV